MCNQCDNNQEEIYEFDGKFYMSITTGWDYYSDCMQDTSILIEYCPYCGRRLTYEL